MEGSSTSNAALPQHTCNLLRRVCHGAQLEDLLSKYAPELQVLCLQDCDNVLAQYFKGISCPRLSQVCLQVTGGDGDDNDDGSPSENLLSIVSRLHCPNLCELDISSTHATDDVVLAVCYNCPLLTAIDITYCVTVTNASIVALLTHCKHLHTLWMRGNVQCTDASLHAIATHGDTLRSVNFQHCLRVTTIGMLQVLSSCTLLHTYSVGYMDTPAGNGVQVTLAQHLPDSVRNIYFSREATDEILRVISQRCPQLEHLDLQGWDEAEQPVDPALIALAQYCPGLRTLVLSTSLSLTDTEEEVLRQALHPNATIVRCSEARDKQLINLPFDVYA